MNVSVCLSVRPDSTLKDKWLKQKLKRQKDGVSVDTRSQQTPAAESSASLLSLSRSRVEL